MSSIVIESEDQEPNTEKDLSAILSILENKLNGAKKGKTPAKIRSLNISDVITIRPIYQDGQKIAFYYNGIDWTRLSNWEIF